MYGTLPAYSTYHEALDPETLRKRYCTFNFVWKSNLLAARAEMAHVIKNQAFILRSSF
jgi:hypothetical protein